MIQVRRETTAERINAILNNEVVRPWVADASDGVLDVTPKVSDQNNFLLMGEGNFGAVFFLKLMPGIYEAHTQVVPEARGGWTKQLTEACVHWMFTRTDAYEILTRVPEGHIAARAAALQQGLRYEFTRPDECRFRGRLVDVHVHSFRVQDWIPVAPNLIERGQWFHIRLNEEARRLGIKTPAHTDDENHNRYVGASLEMCENGQAVKGVILYNRWAIVSRHKPVRLLTEDPVSICMDIGVLRLVDGDIEVSTSC